MHKCLTVSLFALVSVASGRLIAGRPTRGLVAPPPVDSTLAASGPSFTQLWCVTFPIPLSFPGHSCAHWVPTCAPLCYFWVQGHAAR